MDPIKFGTDGWRGVIARDFTFENVRRVAQAIADYVKEGTILIDTPVVTAANAQEWYDKYAKLMPKK